MLPDPPDQGQRVARTRLVPVGNRRGPVPTPRMTKQTQEWPARYVLADQGGPPTPRRANPMFADQLHTEESGKLASVLTTLGWALVGVLVLVAVWKLFSRYGLPNFEGLAARFRGALV